MTITHVIFSFNTGGAELLMSDIMAEQIKAGHCVNLLVINNLYEESLLRKLNPEINVILVNRPEGSRNPWWIFRYNMLLRRTRPDVVHFHQTNSAYITPKWRGVKFVVTIHGINETPRPHPKRIDVVFAISEAVKDDLRERYGVDSVVIPNGIVCNKIIPKSDSDELYDKKFGRPLRIVTIGRLRHTVKGQDLAIKAIARLREMNIDATLDLIGDGVSEQYLCQLVKDCGVKGQVNFRGNCSRDDIYSTIRNYDILLLPSRLEGFGLVIAEAMGAKVPVVVCNLDGPMEVIGCNRYGKSYKCGDVDAMAAAIADVADNYQHYAALAQREAYEHVYKNYDISRTATDYLVNYEKIIER